MPKRKHFLTQKGINRIMKNYGGGYQYSLYQELTNHDSVMYKGKYNNKWISIEDHWDINTDQRYAEVHISDSEGHILRKDRYEFTPETKDLSFAYTNDNGDFSYEFKKLEDEPWYKDETRRLYEKISQLESKISKMNVAIKEKNQEIKHLQEELQNFKEKDISKQREEMKEDALLIIEQNIEQDRIINGRRKSGRPPKITDNEINLIRQLKEKGYTIREIASQLGCSVGTVHRLLKSRGGEERNDQF